ncbi:MAG: pyridoxal phosphate-dependent aminotransferase, partial [Anaerovoracaceae bacterium]
MKNLVHGGDIYTAMEKGRKKEDILDYSANINPLGIPQGVKEAVIKALEYCDSYPDPLCRKLGRAVAEKEQVAFENLIFGNGAADLIFRLVLAVKPEKALVLAPTFAEYEKALELSGCRVVCHRLKEEEDFSLTDAVLDDMSDIDMIFLCNPNNPTGRLIPPELLERILEKCRTEKIIAVVDECFIDFLEDPQKVTVKHLIGENPYLFILRAFTKNYAMPGLRLGYGICGNRELLEAVYETGQPWGVSLVAQEAGIQALKESEYLETARKLIFKERKRLAAGLEALGYKVYPPAANYIFFKLKETENRQYAESFIDEMAKDGIVIIATGPLTSD